MARTCRHPDAMWLTEVVAGRDVSTYEQVRAVFEQNREDDMRWLFFAPLIMQDEQLRRPSKNQPRLRRAAELGFAFAQARLAGELYESEEGYAFAEYSALQGERAGFL